MDLGKFFKEMPKLELEVENFTSEISTPNNFSITVQINEKIIEIEPGFTEIEENIKNTFDTYDIVKKVYAKHNRIQEKCRELQERERMGWLKKLEILDEFADGIFWTFENDEPVCLSGEDANVAEEHLSILPSFLTDPNRFDREQVQVTQLKPFKFIEKFKKIDPEKYEFEHKQQEIWKLHELEIFVFEFFRTPNKFKEIMKKLPEKSYGELIELYYIVKYEFRLKKYMRVQARRKRDDLKSFHSKKIMKKLKKKLPKDTKQITILTLSKVLNRAKYIEEEEYFSFFGKNLAKIRLTHREESDYWIYKDFHFGGDQVHDEGFLEYGHKQPSEWTYEEKTKFVELYKKHHRDWPFIADELGTKTSSQVRNFYENYKKKLSLDTIDKTQDAQSILAAAGIINKEKAFYEEKMK